MQKLETRNGTLLFVEVPENAENFRVTETDGTEFEKLGEVTKEGITFDCETYVNKNDMWALMCDNSKDAIKFLMHIEGIELREGFKFIVLKEK